MVFILNFASVMMTLLVESTSTLYFVAVSNDNNISSVLIKKKSLL
jgi:hypothetical protein